MRHALTVGLLLVAGLVVNAIEPPRAHVQDGSVEVALSGSMLDDARVRQRAESGLTATLVIVDRTSRSDTPAAARISMRYEPWDEVFFVAVVDAGGGRRAMKVGSLDALREQLGKTFVRMGTVESRREQISLEVRLLPFSSEEAVDAREWFLESLGATPKGSASGGLSSVEAVVDVLLATSIQARPVASWKWSVPVRPEPKGDP